jgi:hypothetical protein
MLLAWRFDGGNSVPALFSVQWHEGGGVSNYAPDFAWSCPGYLARMMPRILRADGLEKPRGDAAFGG